MATKTPIVLSDDNRQHYPLGENDTIPVSSIPVSSDAGNSIERRAGGLYATGGGGGDLPNYCWGNEGVGPGEHIRLRFEAGGITSQCGLFINSTYPERGELLTGVPSEYSTVYAAVGIYMAAGFYIGSGRISEFGGQDGPIIILYGDAANVHIYDVLQVQRDSDRHLWITTTVPEEDFFVDGETYCLWAKRRPQE